MPLFYRFAFRLLRRLTVSPTCRYDPDWLHHHR